MNRPLDPGPPLTPAEEFCESDAPSSGEYVRAIGAALAVLAVGAGAWVGIGLLTHRQWGFTAVFLGVAAGWLVHRAAGRHRSRAIGVVAAVSAVLAAATGYGLLWLPQLAPIAVDRHLSWYHLLMAGVGGFVAYRLAGPRPAPKPSE